tara:strand:+ start:67 stop:261 length:195 start_codon:yes stop_codon:yes gene_type:complete
MLYTGIILSQAGNIKIKYIDGSHDWDKAWEKCTGEMEDMQTLLALVPGRHEVVTCSGRKGYAHD